MNLILLIFVTILILIDRSESRGCKILEQPASASIRTDILCDYDPRARPKINESNATVVTLRMVLKYFSYDMHASTLWINNWFALIWKDDHLNWNPAEYDDIKTIHIHSEEIWVPDLSVYNSAGQGGSESAFNHVECLVSSKGTVICVTPNQHDAVCTPELKKFPFDTQNCTLRMGSWVHSGEQVDFRLAANPVSLDDYLPSGEWKLIKVEANKHAGIYSCCPDDTYPTLNYNFIIERHSGAQVSMIIIPAFVLILTTLVTLCLEAEDLVRITVICMNMIAHYLFMQYVSWQIPISGPDSPLILIFARDSLLLSVFTLFLTTIERKLQKTKRTSPIWISALISNVINSRPGRFIFIFDDNFKLLANKTGSDDGANIIENSESQNSDWNILVTVLDRVCLIIYLIVYFCMFIAFVP